MMMSGVCRKAARPLCTSVKMAIAPALALKFAPSSLGSARAPVRALSGGRGGQRQKPWSEHGWDSDRAMEERSHPRRRVVEKKAGDWDCPECGNHVFASRSACPWCQFPRHAVNSFYEASGTERRERPPTQKRVGDWDCPSCHFHNFASRQECYRCLTPKPDEAKVVEQQYGGHRGRGDDGNVGGWADGRLGR